jgi:uncharacterized OB-fold protein
MSRVALKEGLLSSIEPANDPHLLAARCGACRQLHFPASDTCPYCSADRCTIVELGQRAILYVHTIVERPPPGYRGTVPYGFGVVELPERIRILSRLIASRFDLLCEGAPMRLVLEDLFEDDSGRTVVGWAFAAEEQT